MNEGGVKAWEPHQVQNPLAFSDEEEEDLLDFMYKYKTLRKTEFPLEVHGGVWACGLEHAFAQGLHLGDLRVLGATSLGHPGSPECLRWGNLPPSKERASPG